MCCGITIVSSCGPKNNSSVAETGTASSRPRVRSDTTSNPASPRIQGPEGSFPLLLGNPRPNNNPEVHLEDGKKCGCSGNCGQPRHSRNKCQRQYVAIGSLYCRDCECTWMDCHSPRCWGPYCKKHTKALSNLSEAWILVKAAGSLNNQLVPADIPPFISFYRLYPHRFREAVVVAFVKEPGPIEIFIKHLRGVDSAKDPLEHVRRAWRATVGEVVHLGQDLNAVQQLSRQGTGRFSCFARSMSIIGIIENSPSNVEKCFKLGCTRTHYQYSDNPETFY